MELGFLSLVPPLIAIVLAIATKRVILPLAFAVLCGAVILSQDSQTVGAWAVGSLGGFKDAIWNAVTSFDHLRALAFSLLLGAMVGVLEAGGGMHALVNFLSRNIRSRRGGQTLIASLGLTIFFDDYANTLLVGGTMRTTADRFGISRAKLAYLVDSTSAPVAGLSPISTWVVTEITYVAAGLAAIAMTSDVSAFAVFIASIPFRFYPILALVMVFTIAASDRDFGPMRHVAPQPPEDDAASPGAFDGNLRPVMSWAAIIPVAGCVSAVILSLVINGWASARDGQHGLLRLAGEILHHGDSYAALIHGGLIGWILAVLAHRLIGGTSWARLAIGSLRGVLQMLPAMAVLWFAWALSDQTQSDQLDTGGYLASLLTERVTPALLPTAVFIVAAGVAFSTGTSWGTMAILTPLSIDLSLRIGDGDPFGATSIATLGSVLAGAIFGDHCSPISDTTVLSSRASGCDHVTHVRTQMPYALLVGVICIVFGTIPAAMGVSPYLCIALGTLAVIASVFCIGKRNEPVT